MACFSLSFALHGHRSVYILPSQQSEHLPFQEHKPNSCECIYKYSSILEWVQLEFKKKQAQREPLSKKKKKKKKEKKKVCIEWKHYKALNIDHLYKHLLENRITFFNLY